MSFINDMFSPGSIMSGGLTFVNDKGMDAFGIDKKKSTFGAVNNAMQHGPVEMSMEKGRPVGINEAVNERNMNLGRDSTGNARTVGDIAALVGALFGGAALAGGSAAGGASGGAAGMGGGTGLAAGASTGGAASMGGGTGLTAGAGGGAAGMGGGTGLGTSSTSLAGGGMGATSQPGLMSNMWSYYNNAKPYMNMANSMSNSKQQQPTYGQQPGQFDSQKWYEQQKEDEKKRLRLSELLMNNYGEQNA